MMNGNMYNFAQRGGQWVVDQCPYEGGIGRMHGGYGFYHYGFIFDFLLLAVVVIGIILIYRAVRKKKSPVVAESLQSSAYPVESPAIEALKMRFVKGEIEEADYLTKLELLKK